MAFVNITDVAGNPAASFSNYLATVSAVTAGSLTLFPDPAGVITLTVRSSTPLTLTAK